MLKEFRGIRGGFDRGEKRERERERGVAGRDREGEKKFSSCFAVLLAFTTR